LGVGDRIKQFRIEHGIKQMEMAEKLAIKQGSLSDIERGKVNVVTDRVIKDICREYGVNEEWLHTGKGEMIKDEGNFVELIAKRLNTIDDMDKEFIAHYIKLKKDYKEVFKKLMRSMIE